MREHYTYWYLTEIFEAEPKKPAINGEPYYAGLHQLGTPYPLRVEPDSEADGYYVRSGLYGSFLSGGLAGFIYGAEGIWNAEVEPEALYPMWKSFTWRSGGEVQHLKTFAEVRGLRYRGARAQGRAGHAQQDRPGLLVLRLGLLRAHAGARPVPDLLRERGAAGREPARRADAARPTGRPSSIRARGSGSRRASPSRLPRAPC